ncbi:MAG: hypothetical protein ACRDOJ_03570 [Nocardioidaceae bacterium]
MYVNKLRASVAAAALAAAVLTPSTALAGDADTIRAGNCSRAADWKLKLSPQNRRIEVEFEVDANRRGQRWRVSLFHNDRRARRQIFTTRGLSGSFTVRDLENNRAGRDRVRARAVRLGDGQTCVGRARF